MTEGQYVVKVNRREGSVEITGADKEWVAAQLTRLEPVYGRSVVSDADHLDEQDAEAASSEPSTRRRGRSRSNAGGAAKVSASKSALVEEKLTSDMHKRLQEYVAERQDHFKSRQDQAAIIAGFLEDELQFDGVDQSDLGSVYEIMGWRAPVNPRAVINNARERNKYFRGWVDGRARLSVAGQNFARHDSKVPKGAE